VLRQRPVCNAENIERAAERAITMAKRARRLPDYAPVVDSAIQAVSRLR
jgi:hypothetical protein